MKDLREAIRRRRESEDALELNSHARSAGSAGKSAVPGPAKPLTDPRNLLGLAGSTTYANFACAKFPPPSRKKEARPKIQHWKVKYSGKFPFFHIFLHWLFTRKFWKIKHSLTGGAAMRLSFLKNFSFLKGGREGGSYFPRKMNVKTFFLLDLMNLQSTVPMQKTRLSHISTLFLPASPIKFSSSYSKSFFLIRWRKNTPVIKCKQSAQKHAFHSTTTKEEKNAWMNAHLSYFFSGVHEIVFRAHTS